MAERNVVMRPLSLTEILEESFTLYRHHFGLLFGIALIPNVAAGLFIGLIGLMIVSSAPTDFSMLLGAALLSLLGLFILGLGAEVGNGAMTSAISEKILGRQATIGSSYRKIGRRIGPFIGFVLLKWLIIFAGTIFCIIPGIVFSIMLFVSVCIFVIEGRGPKDALERSWNLTNGHGFRIFGLWLLVIILTGIITFGIQSLFSIAVTGSISGGLQSAASGEFTSDNPVIVVAEGMVDGLASALVAPLLAAAVTVSYYDLRVRKEGFDLEMLAESLNRR